MFGIFESMSKPWSIYVVSLWPAFSFSASFSLSLIIQHLNRNTCFCTFLEYLLLLLGDNVDEMAKVQPQGVAYL